MSNIKIVNDGFGRPKPVKEEELFQYGLDANGESSAYHSNIFLSGDSTSIVAVSEPVPNGSVDLYIKSSAYGPEGTRSKIYMHGSGYYENADTFGGGIILQAGDVYDSNLEDTIGSGASIQIGQATTYDGGIGANGGSISITAGLGNVPGGITFTTYDGQFYIYGLPTTNPHSANQIWADPSDGYTLKISQG
jgi:hypothetical protein